MNWDQDTPSNSPRAPGTKLKIRERKGPSRGTLQKCEPHERSPCAPNFGERSHEETLHQERCAPQSSVGFGENIYKLKNADKATFYTPIEARVMSAPTSKSPEEREFVVVSGAPNAHEQKRLKHSEKVRNPMEVMTANGEVQNPRGGTSVRS